MRKIVLILILVVCCIFLFMKATTTKGETNPEKFVELKSLEGPGGAVRDAEFSPNGKYLASASYSNLKIWNSSNWDIIQTIDVGESIRSLSFSPNGSYLAVGTSEDLHLWNATSWQKIKTKSISYCYKIAYSPDGKLIASGSQKNVYIWNSTSLQSIKYLEGHSSYIYSLAFSPDSNFLVSGSYDNTMKVWNTTNWENINNLTAHTNSISSVSFSPNGTCLASSSSDKTLKIWNTTSWEFIENLTENSTSYSNVVFSPNGKYLASGSSYYSIKIWNTSNWKIIKNLTGHLSYIYTVTFSPNSSYLASGSYDKTLKIWNTTNWQNIKNITGHTKAIKSVEFSPDGNYFASGSEDQLIMIWDAKNFNHYKTLAPDGEEGVYSVAYSPNGSLLASSYSNQRIKIWNTTTWVNFRNLSPADSYYYCVAFSPDGKYLAASSNQKIRIWNTTTWENFKNFTGTSSDYSIAFSPDGRYLASNIDLEIKIWDTTTWENLKNLTGHTSTIKDIKFSHDGKYLASGSYDKTVKIWNTTAWNNIITLDHKNLWIFRVAFSIDDKYLTVGTFYGRIKLWDTTDWSLIKNLTGHSNKVVNSLIFSPDGKYLLSGAGDNKIKIWGQRTDVPDLSISKSNITFSKEKIFEEETIEIFAEIQNIGVKTAKNFNVTFFIDKKVINSIIVSTLKPNSTKVLSIEWRALKGIHEISVEIFPEDYLYDLKDENNVAEKTVEVQLCYLPNLTTAETTKSSNPEEFLKYNISIENLGGKNDTIYLSFSSTKTWICYLNRTVVFLKPGETSNATLTVTPSSNAKAGEFSEIEITGISEGNSSRRYSLQVNITVNQIYDISFLSDKNSDSTTPGKKISYNLTILNNGNGFEELNLTLNSTTSINSDNWLIEPKNTSISLNSSEFSTIPISVSPPKNAKANDEAKIVFDLISITQNKTISTKTIIAIASQNHEIDLKVENDNLFANPGERLNCNITIKNNGNSEDSVNFDLSGINYNWEVYLDKYSLELESDESNNLTLFVTPNKDSLANEKAKIKVLAKVNGNILATIDVNITVNQTQSVEFSSDEYYAYVNPGESISYTLGIRNIGNGEDNFELQLSGENSEWGEIDQSLPITFKQNEYKELKLKVTVPKDAQANEEAKIRIEAYSNINSLGFVDTKTTVNQIYEVALEIDKNQLVAEPGKSVEYKIIVKNNGNSKVTFRLELSGLNSNWGYLDDSIVLLDANELKSVTLFVTPPKSAEDDEKAIIKIQAISGSGETSNILSTTTIVKAPLNKEPKPDFKMIYKNKEVTKIRKGELITFDATSSLDEDGEIEVYQWDFGNGDIRYGEIVKYAYPKDTKPGKYTITLNVTDSEGATIEKQMTIEVIDEKDEANWLLYLILIVILIIGLLIVIMLVKIVKNLKDLGKVEKSNHVVGKEIKTMVLIT